MVLWIRGEKMKYCPNCGNELYFDVQYCPSCGFEVKKTNLNYSDSSSENQQDNSYKLAKWAFFGGIFIPLVGWIVGSIALKKAKLFQNEKARKLAIAGIIIGTINFLINLQWI